MSQMERNVRQRAAPASPEQHLISGTQVALEHFESRVLSDVDQRPDRPPILDPNSPLAKGKRTLTWKEIPSWQQDNEYILSGYRR